MFNTPLVLDKGQAKLMGVCAGLARSTGIDVMWLRIGFVVGGIMSAGTAAILYLIIGLVAGRGR